MRVRAATAGDLPSVYEVCAMTGDAGGDASALFDDPTLLGHVWAAPHLTADSSLCTVIDDADGAETSLSSVVGYLVATADTIRFEDWCERMWWPALRARYPLRASRRDRDQRLVTLLHAPEVTDSSITDEFPAHLHINLLPRAQGMGWGAALIERLIAQLRERNVPGVHLGVDSTNEKAIAFYTRMGFTHLTGEPDGGLIMGRRVTSAQ